MKAKSVKKKRCQLCGHWYKPDPRTARFQKACKQCRKECQRQNFINWTGRNPDYQDCRGAKIRVWAAENDYWKRYRASHPEYVRRDNQRKSRSRKKLKMSAKQITISKITVEKLNDIRKNGPFLSAKQIAINRRVNSLIDVLIWKEMSAKQINIASTPGSVP